MLLKLVKHTAVCTNNAVFIVKILILRLSFIAQRYLKAFPADGRFLANIFVSSHLRHQCVFVTCYLISGQFVKFTFIDSHRP